jgi:integral membrane protein
MERSIKESKNVALFGKLAIFEGYSFLALFITMPLKYFAEMPLPNMVVGMIHGVLFICYVLFAIIVTVEQKWTLKRFAILFIASLIPFGTFYIEKKYLRAD